jgi:hypothetical protein
MEIYDEFALDNLLGCPDLLLTDILSSSTDSLLELCFPELSAPKIEPPPKSSTNFAVPTPSPQNCANSVRIQEVPCLGSTLTSTSYLPKIDVRPPSYPIQYHQQVQFPIPQPQFTFHCAPIFPGPCEKYVFYPEPQFDPQTSFISRSSPLRDVSRAFSTAKYSEIFTQHANALLIDKHPQLSEADLRRVERTGLLYFMKNVKVIVPRIGPWKFLSHVRSDETSTERSFNLEGFPIRCKVKEWLLNGDLWRMYHFIKGNIPKKRQL